MMPIVRASLALCVAASSLTLALAQPVQTSWPRGGEGSPQATSPARVETCEAPENTVQPGDTLRYRLDTTGFGASVRVLAGLRYGAASASDSSLVYVAADTVAVGGRDTVRVELCATSGDCREEIFVVGVGRRGRSSSDLYALTDTEELRIAVPVPPGALVCGSIESVGDYEGFDRRRAFFTELGFRELYYRSSRVPGVDELRVTVCDDLGTCDTLDLLFAVTQATLDLPFCDDFSDTRDGRPDPTYWLEDDVYVNDAFAVAAPSVGVASFDGLTDAGNPYGDGFVGTDRLTSVPIDLSGRRVGEVWVKYFLQRGGLAQAPEDRDRLRVEGRRRDGSWIALREPHTGSRQSDPDSVFAFHAVPIDSVSLLHEGFQLRFASEGNGAGSFDVWNLDYVRVEAVAPDSGRYADIALAAAPPSLLEPYTAVPYEQYEARGADLLRAEFPVEVRNLFPVANNVSASTVSVRDAEGNQLVEAALLTGAQFNLPPGLSRFRNALPSTPADELRQAFVGLTREQAREVTLRYELAIDQDQDQLACALANDAAEATVRIADEFAYDDGTAESGLLPGGVGQRIAVRYTSYADDVLRGVRMAFPRLGPLDAARQLLNLEVYIGELDDTPEYRRILLRPYFVSSAGDSLQGFTTYRLENEAGEATELAIPAGDFYLAWQLAADAARPAPVGLDVSRDNAGTLFSEYGFGWVPVLDDLPTIRGSLMFRPVFGDDPVRDSSGDELAPESQRLHVYPNPARDVLFVSGLATANRPHRYRLLDLTGREVLCGELRNGGTVDLSGLATGAYHLEVSTARGVPLGVARVLRHE